MKKIGIVVAMEEEREAIEQIMNNKKNETIYNLTFIIGNIHGTECVLVECGVGKVNAARTTQILIDKYQVNSVINAGCAGAINSELKIGDVVVSNKVVQHDFDITAFDHKKGYVPGIGDYIECDKNLLNEFNNLIEKLSHNQFRTKIGIIASGDMFCTDENLKEEIHKEFEADVVDMECAAIGQVATLDKIPFISIRSVSDIPNGDNVYTYEENVKLASERCANILEKYCALY